MEAIDAEHMEEEEEDDDEAARHLGCPKCRYAANGCARCRATAAQACLFWLVSLLKRLPKEVS